MPLHPTAWEIALRLALSLIAGAMIGFNRGERGRAAGLRTTILVCLAASLSMIQTNLLLDMSGKTPASFAVMDLMRLPLGILSGMGFIGAGAILRKGDHVQGVTTAATLWFVTVMGLCFGGGQIVTGLAALGLALGVLYILGRFETKMHQDHRGSLKLVLRLKTKSEDSLEHELRQAFLDRGFRVGYCSVITQKEAEVLELEYELNWRAHPGETAVPDLYSALMAKPEISRLEWRPAEHSTYT